MSNGIFAEGQKYQFLRVEDDKVVLGKKKDLGAITLQASKTGKRIFPSVLSTPQHGENFNCFDCSSQKNVAILSTQVCDVHSKRPLYQSCSVVFYGVVSEWLIFGTTSARCAMGQCRAAKRYGSVLVGGSVVLALSPPPKMHPGPRCNGFKTSLCWVRSWEWGGDPDVSQRGGSCTSCALTICAIPLSIKLLGWWCEDTLNTLLTSRKRPCEMHPNFWTLHALPFDRSKPGFSMWRKMHFQMCAHLTWKTSISTCSFQTHTHTQPCISSNACGC